MASKAVLRVADAPTVRVEGLERREPEGGHGPALLWFYVPAGTFVDPRARHELAEAERVLAIDILDVDAATGLVIAVEAQPLAAAPAEA